MQLKQILTLLRQDLTNAMRDNLVIYMFIAPILLALGARVLLPSLETTTLTYAVETGVGEAIIGELEALGSVEQFATVDEVIARVERSDDVPGIVAAGDGYRVYLEGNEPEGETMAGIIMSSVLREEQVATYIQEQLSASRSLLTEYGAVVLLMLSVMIGALVMGFLMVDDKESKAIQALAVSPLTLTHYLFARGLFALIFSTVVALISTAIFVGAAVNYAQLLVGFVIAAGVGLIVGYVVGGFTDTQLEAIGLIKVVMFAYLTIPILTIFVPENWLWPFYLLPNFWMFKIFENLFVGQIGPAGFWMACTLTLLSTVVYVVALTPLLRRRVQLRFA